MKLPPWLISADSQGRKSKSGRVPITLPTSTTTTTTTTTTTRRTTTTTTTTTTVTVRPYQFYSSSTINNYPQDRYGYVDPPPRSDHEDVRVNSPVSDIVSDSESSFMKPKIGARIRDDQRRKGNNKVSLIVVVEVVSKFQHNVCVSSPAQKQHQDNGINSTLTWVFTVFSGICIFSVSFSSLSVSLALNNNINKLAVSVVTKNFY